MPIFEGYARHSSSAGYSESLNMEPFVVVFEISERNLFLPGLIVAKVPSGKGATNVSASATVAWSEFLIANRWSEEAGNVRGPDSETDPRTNPGGLYNRTTKIIRRARIEVIIVHFSRRMVNLLLYFLTLFSFGFRG